MEMSLCDCQSRLLSYSVGNVGVNFEKYKLFVIIEQLDIKNSINY